MKIVQPERFLGEALGGPRLVFNKQEREVMRRAAAIFDAADTMLTRAGVDQDDYDVRGIFIDGWDNARTIAEQGEWRLPD